jgi:hypothetical protein
MSKHRTVRSAWKVRRTVPENWNGSEVAGS